jgi:hypothetical protein
MSDIPLSALRPPPSEDRQDAKGTITYEAEAAPAANYAIDAIDAIDAIISGLDGEKTQSDRAARAGMEQYYLIPTDGQQDLTTRWETYMFMLFR